MFGKKWQMFWDSFDKAMNELPGAIDEAIEGGVDGVTVTQVTDGHVKLRGKFKSLRINGRLIRIPKEVLEGT